MNQVREIADTIKDLSALDLAKLVHNLCGDGESTYQKMVWLAERSPNSINEMHQGGRLESALREVSRKHLW